jgi:hypothetical protein
MATPINDYSKPRDMLAGKFSERIKYSSNRRLRFKEVTRGWYTIAEPDFEECVECLYFHTDAKNKQRQQWVEDPIVGKRHYKGKWRLVDVGYDRERKGRPGIFETLRKGNAIAIDWREARLASSRELPGNSAGSGNHASDDPEKYLRVFWANLDPERIDAIVNDSKITGGTVSDPKIQNKVYSGDWHKISIDTDEDKSERPRTRPTSSECLKTLSRQSLMLGRRKPAEAPQSPTTRTRGL